MENKRNEYFRSYYNEQSSYWASIYKSAPGQLTIYASHFRQRMQVILRMIEKLANRTGKKALEAGCGPGAYIKPLLLLGYDVSAIDQSEGMVEQARQNIEGELSERVTLGVSGIESISFPDECFDIITNVAVLMYVPDDAKPVREFYRLLKPGGTLIITVDNKKDLADMIDIPMRLRGIMHRIRGNKAPQADKKPDHLHSEAEPRCYSPSELRALLEAAGFTIDEEASVGFAPFRFNRHRIFSDRIDIFLDRMLQFLRYIPGLRLTGYTYICRCHKP